MRTGILGGVFNPPHIGHLICAQEAQSQLALGSVLLMPVGEAPHREVTDDPGADVRVELCRRAAASDERIEVSTLEVERSGPSYTADTLRELRGRGGGDELFLILGGDQAAALPDWHQPEEVLRLATVAVAERDGAERERITAAVRGLAGGGDLVFIDMPRVDVSSTMIRERAAAGRPLRYLVPDGVADLIEERGLYASSAAVPAR